MRFLSSVAICLSQRNKSYVRLADRFLPASWHQVVRNMLEMGLNSSCSEFAVVSEMMEVLRILLEMSFELFAVDKFLSKFPSPRFSDSNASNSLQSVIDSVSKCFDLGHVELIILDVLALLLLTLHNLC